MKVKIIILCLAACSMQPARAQQTAEKLLQETRYLLYLPEDYGKDTVTRWPLVLFLHGSGERGNDLSRIRNIGLPELVEQGKQFPFIILSPQAEFAYGWEPEGVYRFLQSMKEKYRVDNERIYLTGLSLGGFGVWGLAIKHPEEFAAIVPICGGGDTTEIWRLRYMPVWCFHGAKDDLVPVEKSLRMVGALQKYNPAARITVYPDGNHNAWSATYRNDSLYSWLLAQKRWCYKDVELKPALLESYTGIYMSAQKDSVAILAENGRLTALVNNKKFPLKPFSDSSFYFRNCNMPYDIRFIKNSKGKVLRFEYFGDSKTNYIKLK